MADRPAEPYGLARIGRAEFQGNRGAYSEIGDGEQIQPAVADLDPECIHVSSSGKQADAAVEPMPLPTPAIRMSTSQDHNPTTVP